MKSKYLLIWFIAGLLVMGMASSAQAVVWMDRFETYNITDELSATWTDTNTWASHVGVDFQRFLGTGLGNIGDGSRSMQLKFSIPADTTNANGGTSFKKTLVFTAETGIKLWIRASVPDANYKLEVWFHEPGNGDKWKSLPVTLNDLDQAGEYVFLPLDSFTRYGGKGGDADDGILDKRSRFFYVRLNYAGAPSADSSATVWVDTIGAATEVALIDDLESYVDKPDLQATWSRAGRWGSGTLNRYLDTTRGLGNSPKSMRLDAATSGTGGIGGWTVRFGSWDWTGATGIKLWIDAAVSGGSNWSDVVYRVFFHETGGDRWKTDPALSVNDVPPGGGYVFLPWSMFVDINAAGDGVMQLGSIERFQVSGYAFESALTVAGDSFSIWYDDIAAARPGLVRKPYLQNVTQNSVDVMWGSPNYVTSGTLYWGTSPGNYPNEVPSTSFDVDPDELGCYGPDGPIDPFYSNRVHTAKISGLTLGQKVYYYVRSGSSTVGKNDNSYYAITAPSDDASFRFIAYGDSRPGCSNLFPADNIRARLVDTMNSHDPDIVLHMGDIARNGMLKQFDDFYFTPAAPLAKNTSVFPTLGNHDFRWIGCDDRPYRSVFNLPTNIPPGSSIAGPEEYYSFDYGPVHFVSLSSERLNGSIITPCINPGIADEMKAWFINDLDATTKPWKVVFFHRQYYLPSIDTAWRAIFEDYGVDLVIAGHRHLFESHYRNDGVTYIVTGGGGSPLGRIPNYTAPVPWSDYEIFNFSNYHFVQVDVNPTDLTIEVYDDKNFSRGGVIVITKPTPVAIDDFESAFDSTW